MTFDRFSQPMGFGEDAPEEKEPDDRDEYNPEDDSEYLDNLSG